MSKVLKVVGTIAGAAVILATGGAALAGAGAFLGTTAAAYSSIASWAALPGDKAKIGAALRERVL